MDQQITLGSLQSQLFNCFAESNQDQMEAFEKTTEVFQAGLESIQENVKTHTQALAGLIVATTSLEGRSDQLDLKLQAQNQLQLQQEDALQSRLNAIAETTNRLQYRLLDAQTKMIEDAKIIAAAEKNLKLFKPVQNQQGTQAIIRNSEALKNDIQKMGTEAPISLTECQEKLGTLDKDIDALTNRYNGHGHHWWTRNDFNGNSYLNYTSGNSI